MALAGQIISCKESEQTKKRGGFGLNKGLAPMAIEKFEILCAILELLAALW